MAQLNDNLTPNTTDSPLSTSRTSTPLPPPTLASDSSQFPLLTAYHSAADPLAYITTIISNQSDTFISELTNFLHYADQANDNYRSLRTLHQDATLELDSLRLVYSDLQTQLQTTISQRDIATSQRDQLISSLGQSSHTPARSAEHPGPQPFSGTNPAELPNFLSGLALKLRTNSDWYPTLQTRMAYVYSCLEGLAAGQLTHGIKADGTITFTSVEEMLQILRQAYGDIDPVYTAQQRVITIRQNFRQTDLFLAEWQEAALASGLSDNTLIALLHASLHTKILQRLSFTPRENQPTVTSSFVAWIRQVDATLRAAEPYYWKSKTPTTSNPQLPPNSATPNLDAMDISAATTTVTWTAADVTNKRRPGNQAERDARKAYNIAHKLCQWCSEPSHSSTACPTAPWNKGKA